jgi:hypothetical protein
MSAHSCPHSRAELLGRLAHGSALQRQALLSELGGQVGNRQVARLMTTATLQRAIPAERKIPHNDQTTQEMEIQIDRAMALMARRDLNPTLRIQLMLAIQHARSALEQYRDSISTIEPGMRVSPMMATTTTDPISALFVGLLALAAALVASGPAIDPRGRPNPGHVAAEALRQLAKPVKEIIESETAPRPQPPTGDVFPLPDRLPRPDEEEPRRRRRKCTKRWGPPAGGDEIHDKYARHVAEKQGDPSFATLNYFVADEDGGADFDHFHADAKEYFEVKTRHEIVMREWAPNQPRVVARLLDQAAKQLEILHRCGEPGWRLVWFFDDPGVAKTMKTYLPPEIEVRHEPWPGGQRPPRGSL